MLQLFRCAMDIGEQMLACSVEIDAYFVYAHFHSLI